MNIEQIYSVHLDISKANKRSSRVTKIYDSNLLSKSTKVEYFMKILQVQK